MARYDKTEAPWPQCCARVTVCCGRKVLRNKMVPVFKHYRCNNPGRSYIPALGLRLCDAHMTKIQEQEWLVMHDETVIFTVEEGDGTVPVVGAGGNCSQLWSQVKHVRVA